MYSYNYPRPALTVDSVVFSIENNVTEVLLIQRNNEPWKDMWALPGGFLEVDETCNEGARRELEEETGLTGIELHQLYVYDAINRDPRERIITIAHWGITQKSKHQINGRDDARDAQWFNIKNLPPLAADHKLIIEKAISDNLRLLSK